VGSDMNWKDTTAVYSTTSTSDAGTYEYTWTENTGEFSILDPVAEEAYERKKKHFIKYPENIKIYMNGKWIRLDDLIETVELLKKVFKKELLAQKLADAFGKPEKSAEDGKEERS